jgi:hypothetical protein
LYYSAMKYTKANWSKLYGVSRAAVTLAVQSGALVAGADKLIDDQDQANAAWVARHAKADGAKAAAAPKAKPAKASPRAKPAAAAKPGQALKPPAKDPPAKDPPTALLDDVELPIEDIEATENMGTLTIEKIKAEIRYKREAAEAYRIKRLAALGVLVEREHVRQVLGKFNAEQRIRLLELPGTLTPRLVALARAGSSEHEVAAILEDEIARAIDSAKAVITRAHLGAS